MPLSFLELLQPSLRGWRSEGTSLYGSMEVFTHNVMYPCGNSSHSLLNIASTKICAVFLLFSFRTAVKYPNIYCGTMDERGIDIQEKEAPIKHSRFIYNQAYTHTHTLFTLLFLLCPSCQSRGCTISKIPIHEFSELNVLLSVQNYS